MARVGDFNERQQIAREHRQSWVTFERAMLFAVLHIALTLVSVALAFLGHVKLIALLFWTAGTLAMIAAFVVRGASLPDR